MTMRHDFIGVTSKKEYHPSGNKMKFLDIKTPEELALALETDYKKYLIYYLYRLDKSRRYLSFDIPKKTGGTRKIKSPASHLKTIQKRLKALLEEVYRHKVAAHGFIKGKSIISNADCHINKRYVLNIDLENFFGAINFGRVRGMFLNPPYNFPEKVATILAQMCCHENALPQGAPTSPIISNMICSRLDSNLRHLAEKYRCMYTRYADDITFSTTRKTFPKAIAESFSGDNAPKTVSIGQELAEIIKTNGFTINEKKTRLQDKNTRQEVTGLVTNKKRNVNRRFIRNTRAILFSWDKHGADTATQLHYKKNATHIAPPFKSPPTIEQIARGRIEFIRSIRDDNFWGWPR